jgi:hypothetical protein
MTHNTCGSRVKHFGGQALTYFVFYNIYIYEHNIHSFASPKKYMDPHIFE